jgi:HlyD family secretion protein
VKKILLFLAFTGAGLAGMLVWFHFARAANLTENNLTFAVIQKGTMTDVVSATGVVEPLETIVVSAEIPGMINVLLARVNDTVEEGAILATLEDSNFRFKVEEAENGVRAAKAGLAQAEAARDASQIALKTQVDLESKGGFRSEREQADAQARAARAGVLAAQAKLESAAIGVKEAKLALAKTQVKVPGQAESQGSARKYHVMDRKAQLGQMVGPQAGPLFTLAGDLARVDVLAQVAEGDISKVKPGLNAQFTLSGYGDDDIDFSGTVKEIRPQAFSIKGAVYYNAVIDVQNKKDAGSGQWRLRPGMTVSVDIIRREHKGVWKVPSAALNFRLEDAYQTEVLRDRLAEWMKRPDHDQWVTLWTWDSAKRQPWPLFVRLGGLKNGETGLKDSEGNEILEWEPGQEPSAAHPPPRVIIAAPPAHNPGFFDMSKIKVS